MAGQSTRQPTKFGCLNCYEKGKKREVGGVGKMRGCPGDPYGTTKGGEGTITYILGSPPPPTRRGFLLSFLPKPPLKLGCEPVIRCKGFRNLGIYISPVLLFTPGSTEKFNYTGIGKLVKMILCLTSQYLQAGRKPAELFCKRLLWQNLEPNNRAAFFFLFLEGI